MLHVFCGSDTVAVRTKALATLAPFEEAGIVPVRLECEVYEAGALEHFLGGASLFGEVTVCVLDTPSGDELFSTAVTTALPELAASPNTFVLIDAAPLAAYRKALEKHATSFTEIKAAAAERGNPFALGDAFAARDKKALWIELQKQLRRGARPEELVGTFWWQLKSIRLAALTHTAEEAGMKEFPYKKATAALRKYSLVEAEKLSRELITLYHDAHAGKGDMEVKLERWVLGV